MNLVQKCILILVFILSSSFYCLSQTQNIEEIVTHFIRTGDEKSVPLIESGFRELGISKDTTTINKLIGFLIEEREVIKNDKAHLFVLDIMLGPLLVANNEYDKGISILNESYNNIKEIRDVEADAIYSISYLLSISHNAKGDYSRALKYGNEMLKLSGKCIAPSAPFTSYLQIAISELGLGNLHSAYRNIQKAYQSPDKDKFSTRLNINSTYIDVLKQLTRVACTKNDINNVIKYYKEAQKIIIDYPGMDLSLYIDDEYILELATILVEATDNQNDINKFIKEILEIKGAEYALYPDSELSRVDYITLYCRMVAESALEKGRVSVGKAFYDYAHILTKEESAISTKISDNTNLWYSIYLSKYENDFLFGTSVYAEQINNAIDKKDVIRAKELLPSFLNLYDCATFSIREFHRNSDFENGIHVLPPNDVNTILNTWQNLASKYTSTFGKHSFNNLITSYRDEPKDFRVFPFYSNEDTKLMKLHLLIYQKDYQSFELEFERMCRDCKLSEEQIIEIILRIKELLYRNYDYFSASTFLETIQKYDYISQNPRVVKSIDNAMTSLDDWVNFNISTAQGLSEDGKYDEAMALFDDILDQIFKNNGMSTSYLETLNSKALESLIHQKYNDAKFILEKADSLYQINKINNIPIRYTLSSYMSFCYAYLGDFDKSLKSSIDTYKHINHMRDEYVDFDYWGELCTIYWRQGSALWNLGNFTQAEDVLMNAYNEAIENHVASNTKNILIKELMLLYKNQILKNKLSANDTDDIFLKASKLALDNPDSEDADVEFFEDIELLKRILSVSNNNAIIDTYQKVVNACYTSALERGNITDDTYINSTGNNTLNFLGHICRNASLYQKAIDLYLMSIEQCTDQFEIASRYSTIGNIYEYEHIDICKSLHYHVLSCKTLIAHTGAYSNEVKDAIYRTFLVLKNSIASSTHYALEIYDDKGHPHFSYDENLALICSMSGFLADLKEQYGISYLNDLNDYFLQKANEYSLETRGTKSNPLPIDLIDPLARCFYEKTLLNISTDHIQAYIESLTSLISYINDNYEGSTLEDMRLNIITSVSNSLFVKGYYDHAKELLISQLSDNRKSDEKIIIELLRYALKVDDWEFAYKILFSDAARIHENYNGFEHYKTYWDINILADQLLFLYRSLREVNHNMSDDYLAILNKLINLDCVGMNNNHLRPDLVASIYNDLGCFSESIADEINYFRKAHETSPENITFILNLASSLVKNAEYSEADKLLDIILKHIDEYYIYGLTKHFIYSTKLNSALHNAKSEISYFSRKLLSNAVEDFMVNSKTMSSLTLANYWNKNYSGLLSSITTADAVRNEGAENSYDAALFHKGVLLRSQNYRANNILNSNDTLLIKYYNKYCYEQQHNTDSVEFYEKAMLYYYSLHPEFLKGEITPSWKDVRSRLSNRDMAIEFSTMHDTEDNQLYYVALILTRQFEAPKMIRLCKCNDLHSLINNKQKNGYSIAYDEYIDGVNVIYSLIWSRLEEYLKGYKNIFFSPCDQLNFINLECIAKNDGGKRMNEIYNIRRVSTTGHITSNNLKIESVVLYGGIDYNNSEYFQIEDSTSTMHNHSKVNSYSNLRGYMDNWGFLDNTVDEIENINKQFINQDIKTTKYSYDKATEESFKHLSSNSSNIIHLATHGYYFTTEGAQRTQYLSRESNNDLDPGRRSGILFSGANVAWSGSIVANNSEDGILNSDEIMGMNLSSTDLVVLSACQSGLGDINNDGTYGIQRSFKIAGVNSIIMSLWEVDDEATKILMTALYEKLAKGISIKDSFDYAVNTVKLTYEKRSKSQPKSLPKYKRYDSAYYWTSFILLD